MENRAGFMRSCILAISLTLTVITARGQITTDGTVGSAQSLTGPNYAIGAGLGTQRGANLFHSFSTFISIPEKARPSAGRAACRM